MLIDFVNGATSVIVRVKIRNSSGAGVTGLTNATSGLIISTIADNEASATAYTSAGSTIDSITTLGTYATPTATHCNFKQVDSTNHPGVYEVQLANARFAVSNAKSLLISIPGSPISAVDTDVVIPLRSVNPYDGVRFGLTSLPNAAAAASGGLPTIGTGTGQINVDGSGSVHILGPIKKAAAFTWVFYAVLATDHASPATGKTIAIQISKDAAALGNPSAGATNATEIGSGFYSFSLSTTDTNCSTLAVLCSVATVDPVPMIFSTTP